MRVAIEKYLKRTGFERFEPRLALFDMDGVLYNSMPNHAIAWRESMAAYGLRMTEEDAFAYEGMRGVETIRLMARQQWGRDITDEEAQEMYRHKSELYARFPSAGIISGVQELQKALKAAGLTIGVVTGSGQPSLINRILHDFEGIVSPDIIVTANDVKHGKPAPEPYLKGMQKASDSRAKQQEAFEPWQTIVVENAPLGVQAGVAARCLTVAVNTGPLPDALLREAGADAVFNSMHEFMTAFSHTIFAGQTT